MERETNMGTRETAKRFLEAPINYALLKLIHHEIGNGLAVISGYRHLLQRSISRQAREPFPPAREVWHEQNEQWLSYLQTIRSREERLNNLLAQLRELSLTVAREPLCQHKVVTDLAGLLGQIIEQRAPLCPDRAWQVNMPAQSLFIKCDPFWLHVLFEHVLFNYTFTARADNTPAELHLEPFPDSMGRQAIITLRFRTDLPKLTARGEDEFGEQIRALEHGETEACLALCHEILHEHGGHIWSEQEGNISLTLPLAE